MTWWLWILVGIVGGVFLGGLIVALYIFNQIRKGFDQSFGY